LPEHRHQEQETDTADQGSLGRIRGNSRAIHMARRTVSMQQPTLYRKSSKGKLLQWTVWTEENTIITEWGESTGQLQTTQDLIKECKNPGKKNETTPTQQAEKEAKALWTKKLKGGYVKTSTAAMAGETSELIKGGIWPMLAHRYDKKGDKISFPAYAQPKLDGHRCIAMVDENGKCTLWSRKRMQITSMPHIVKAIEELGCVGYLDGELYNHAYKDEFETITHMIKRDTPCPGGHGCTRTAARGGPCKGYTEVQYHIYDTVPLPENIDVATFELRIGQRDLVLKTPKDPLIPVDTIDVEDEDDVMLAFERWLDEGYEGAIIRNRAGKYKSVSASSRSTDLQKVKEFDDDEFIITDVKEGKGKLAGHGIFICKTADGAAFEAKMKGKLVDLKQYWDDKSLAVGRQMTVQYQGYTKKSKVPRFPVAVRFREDV
jgi:DNA ligase-1